MITKPILTRFFFLYLVIYEFAQFGIYFFGSQMTMRVYRQVISPGHNYYYTLNFNDYASAVIVLFQQMLLNNWYVVVDMISGYTHWPTLTRTFFVLYWIIVVLILVNIIVAVVIEIHQSLQDENEEKFRRIRARKLLYQELQDDDRDEMRRKLDEARKLVE